jgi:uncharacterized membrane protein YjgN (DUF898 family)
MVDDSGGAFWDLERYRRDTVEEYVERRRERQRIRLGYDGNGMVLFWVALRTVLLTILTLGLYRFWMITRMRRIYWGSIRIDGDPLEYTGRGIEKLLGFLLAVVVLAVYLGAVNLALTFAGLSFAADDPVVLQLSLQLSALSALPFIYYATYRAQRYMLARTRWRGIRFGLGPGAVGYTIRSLGWTVITVVTLGLAWPYQHFKQAKYITDRAYFGDMPFRQEGGWGELFAQWIWLYILGGLGALMVWGLVENPDDTTAWFLGTLVLSFGGMVLLLAFQRYQVAAFRILWSGRHLGESAFENDLSAGRVLGIYIGGSMAVGICSGLLAALITVALFVVAGEFVGAEQLAAAMQADDPSGLLAAWPQILAGALGYLTLLGFAFAFTQVFLTMPILRAKVEGMTVSDPVALTSTRQRPHDAAAEAGGFADALGVDVGAGL